MLPRSLIRPIAVVLGVLTAALVVVGIVYLTTKASSLPAFLPGHLAERVTKRGRVIGNKAHVKRGLAVLGLAAATLVTTWWLAFRYEPAD
jgi:hypothetical protein